jgi:hypothetical protein
MAFVRTISKRLRTGNTAGCKCGNTLNKRLCQRIITFFCAAILACMASCGPPVPSIKAKTSIIDCGKFKEGTKEIISGVFILKNTGRAPLHIKSVKASCGCTVVSFDTLILPRKTGVVRQEVKLKGFKGKISKRITVMSDAKNHPALKLYLTAEIIPADTTAKKPEPAASAPAGK